jgi:phosphoribosyl 1,2-cyclic phosphodiesterase
MRFSVLASGSLGNACYIETSRTRILVDAGLSCKEVVRRLDALGVDPVNLDALLITHEHMDHIKGAGPLARRFDLPVYLNASTMRKSLRVLGGLSRPVTINTGQDVTIRDLRIETFTKCHDAADPMGFVISIGRLRLGVLTDLGRSTRVVVDRLKRCQALVMEFNHDEEMLEEGPYPLQLKRRIRGPDGHLSNRQAGELLSALCHHDLRCVVLAHLSATNNTPEKAMKEATRALSESRREGTSVIVSHQDVPSPMITM